MSFTFGLYDFFSYTVPGVLYILVADRLLSFFHLPHLDVNQFTANFSSALIWVVAAFVVGHLMDSISIRWYYRLIGFKAETKAMHDFKDKYKRLEIDFTIHDRQSLFSVVRHNNLDLALYIDNFKAMSFMLNNISLGLFLLVLEQVTEMIVGGFTVFGLVAAALAAVFSAVALNRSAMFNEWHWRAVYQHARQYGKSIPEMFGSKSTKSAGKK